ncbi:hypothetical protein K503DRAFT_805590 [Rhizopogon vinicolor AM-OR11-026]|uniref:Uncharacterized protein n=1 Tax=Rhizopogon vinicolor AM-OR11-026 TaxID=1314800 RepID=A0A1B7MHE5_9AGAM|nr:hypothetical protein K503DRAFT_805590 [Rhizopogon vinicolor AM-OR11-026]
MSLSTEHNVARDVLTINTTLAGLMVLEYAWNIRFEMRVIWPQFWKGAEAKIFVVARYLGLAGEIFNVWFASRMASGIPNHPLACRAWYSYHAATVQCLLMSVELLLMRRVCKMYNNDRYIIGILHLFAIAQCAGMAISAWMVVPGLSPSPTCVMVESHPGQIYLGASTIVINLCLLAMILWRYFRGNWQEPLCSYFKITVRDSICTVITVTGIFMFMVLEPIGVHLSQTSKNIHFQLILFSLWFATGRLVLDKERFFHELQNNNELTEVDLDDLEPPDDSDDLCPARPSNSEVVPTDVAIAFNSESGVGTEEDITDERLCDLVDDALLSRCAMCMQTGNGVEGSESRK